MEDDKMCQCGHYESDHGVDGSCCSSASTGYCPCFIFDDSGAPPDPRDAEIARLKAEVEARRIERDNARETSDLRSARIERMERALAAGPAALRAVALQARAAGETILADGALDCAANVEAAQEAAMKEWK